MRSGRIITERSEIREVLHTARTIAVLGLSPKPERDSFKVGQYLKEQGYTVVPVRPAQKEILGERAYASLTDIPFPVDIIDAFRSAKEIPRHLSQALTVRPRVFWMQLGIENHAAAEALAGAGIDVIMNRCIKIEHDTLIRKKIIL